MTKGKIRRPRGGQNPPLVLGWDSQEMLAAEMTAFLRSNADRLTMSEEKRLAMLAELEPWLPPDGEEVVEAIQAWHADPDQ